ncbi:MAG TPA: DUF2254 domain-containing protein [Caldisericia bacterium]|nr:DUF2254 domain-containing protein [Caldisericia bacterium]
MKKLKVYFSEIKSSFWFVPVLTILVFIVLAVLMLRIDSITRFSQKGLSRYIFISSADSARSILTTIAGAMIGVAGTVFSITLVVLTLASSQFGPRLIRNFMYQRLNQIVLGSYISTYMYCLVVLNAIKDNTTVVFIPSLSVLVALLAAGANIVLLVLFIHHIAVSIQANDVIAKVSQMQSKNIDILFPKDIGTTVCKDNDECSTFHPSFYTHQQYIPGGKNGYLQYVYNESLFSIAKDTQSVIEVYSRPGVYIVKSIEVGMIYSNSTIDADIIQRIQRQFIIGNSRTQEQDVEHFIHQMVEIAERALSPGINDPYTAITCIDNLSATMVYLAQKEFPSRYIYDEEGNVRLILNVITYESVLDAAFNQIRQYSKGNPTVVIRLMEALITVNKCVLTETQRKAVQKHAKMVLNMAMKTFDEPRDLEDLKERSKQIGIK